MCQKILDRINLVQLSLAEKDLNAFIIPSADPHQSEYLPDYWKIREWLSGFTGSAGTLVITGKESCLWTDSRYFLQAEEELRNTGIILQRMGEKGVPTIVTYLCDQLEDGSKVGLNPLMWSHKATLHYKNKLLEKNISISTHHNPAEEVWNKDDRPSLPKEQIFIHPLEFATRSVEEKLKQVREGMKESHVEHHLITTLDDIAWLYNLRGSDVAFNPVFLAFTVINQEGALLFVDEEKINNDVKDHLSHNRVEVRPYDSISSYLSTLKGKILVNPEDCNEAIYKSIDEQNIEEGSTISRMLKACKTSAEIEHIERAMIKDGLALAHAFYELFERLIDRPMTEAEFAAVIAERRSEQEGYYGESFPAIIGYQSNGAIVHYRPHPNTSATIKPEGLLLCDSGGQYFDGTTDITRTVAMGPTSQEQREAYTRVLKGHIAIDKAVFPQGTTGGNLDILARQYLWRNGQNFGHGTGHGVGYFLNVHEPPQGISPGPGTRATTAFKPGMLTSNEPGYYETGTYGIRIENLIVTEKSEFEGYLKHRHLTLFPIDTSIIIGAMLHKEEVEWVNDYHEKVEAALIPHLSGPVRDWMIQQCKRI